MAFPLVSTVKYPFGSAVVTVSFTSPGFVPITACVPFTVSLAINETIVVPPAFPLIEPKFSATASIPGVVIVTSTLFELQFVGFSNSQISYVSS